MRSPRFSPLSAAGLLALFGLAACSPSGRDALPDVVDFDAHIQPILSDNCYVCHGPDVSTREAGLRLDLRDSALVALESGAAAVVPGDPEASELLRRLRSDDPEERMPPPEVKKVLDPQDIALLERWIEQGAEYRPHWALVPPEKPEPPRVRRLVTPENPVDRFIEARLIDAGIPPAPNASKTSLLRRLSFVLTGLPPSPEGLEAFLADSSPDAYEHLVDRLLASPHFGERWARHWMDVVRYADTKGHEFDYPVVGAWTYRDYLIRAFNQDLPYDRFVMEHLAGDLLEEPRQNVEEGYDESVIGTLFYALGEGTHSPVDLQIDEAGRIDNVIDVTGKAFMGLTVACARCHDHKFDPIPTTDYYSLYGIVKSTRWALRDVRVTPNLVRQAEALDQSDQDLRAALGRQWLAELEALDEPPATLRPERPLAPADTGVTVLADFRTGTDLDGWRADGLAFRPSTVSGVPVFDGDRLTALQLPRVSSAARSHRLFGTLRSPTFTIDADHITVQAAGRHARVRLIIDNFQLIQYPIYGGLEQALDDSTMQEYTFDIGRWKGRPAYLELFPGYFSSQKPVLKDSAYVEVEYAWMYSGDLPRRTEPAASLSGKELTGALAGAVRGWMAGEASYEAVSLLNDALDAGLISADVAAVAADRALRAEREAKLPAPVLAMTMLDDIGVDQPVFVRGNVVTPSEETVPRRFMHALQRGDAPFEEAGSGRRSFASAVIDPANPLTARVMVNRIWHHVFGKGLVETVDNFGLQGARPEHRELLDYLAVRFVEEGWSVKAMVRLLVNSEAFQRSTAPVDEAIEQDPQNRLWHSYPVRRLEAEAIRDAMLSVSGRLDPTMYGEPVPVYLSDFMTGRGRPGDSGPLDGDGRRSIYLSLRRNFLSPFMLVFDMPIPFSTFGSRNTSNVPAQSLALLNDPFVAQQAEVWGRRIVALKELDAPSRIRLMYTSALSREATAGEVDAALAFLDEQATLYGLEPASAANDTRVWRDFAHTLFNLKEFIHLV
ncbi:MAG: PSD1 and planctomycete cytochrome C domain-containing protein [Rhodothermales bacterium]|nr:PSD1 and planctomycete cytochrome C domain-containing protein [Rhodothermales bacterium]